MIEKVYKYPAQLCIGDLLIDVKTREKHIVRDFSVYSFSKNGETYRRASWVQVGSAIYTPKVLFDKFRSNDIKQLEVAGSVLVT